MTPRKSQSKWNLRLYFRIPPEWRRENRKRHPEKLAEDLERAFDSLWFHKLVLWALIALHAIERWVYPWLVSVLCQPGGGR